METLSSWLEAHMDRRGLNQSQVAAYLDTTPSTVNRWLAGKSFPATESCRKLAELFREPIGKVYQLAHHPAPDYVPAERQPLSPQQAIMDALADLPIPVPVYDQLVSAGEGQHPVIETMWLPPTATRGKRGNLIGLAVRGYSMEPTIMDGDIVILDTDATPREGDTVVGSVDGGVFVKRLRRKAGHLVLEGTNGTAMSAEEAHIAGVVIQVVRNVPRG